ncbi:MAG: hypothetical protein AAFQ36_10845 [Pseudomonadota bacterium]
MGRFFSYLVIALLLGVAGIAVYAIFADLPAPQTRIEVPVDVAVPEE